MDDDQVNAFLGFAITAWSFPSPIPSQVNVAAADKVIGRAMKAKDWSSLRKQARPLIEELEGTSGKTQNRCRPAARVFFHQLAEYDPGFAPEPPKGFPAEMMLYRRFAKAYGWPPEVVRN